MRLIAEAPHLPAVSQAQPAYKPHPNEGRRQYERGPTEENTENQKKPLKWEFEAYNLCKQETGTQKVIAEMLARISSSH